IGPKFTTCRRSPSRRLSASQQVGLPWRWHLWDCWLRRWGGGAAVGWAAGGGAGGFGKALGAFTGGVLGNSAGPLRLATRKTLPLLFGASAAASLASIFDLMSLADRERTIAHRFGIAGRVAELAAGEAVERQAARTLRWACRSAKARPESFGKP